jgi:hypothetical protein
MGLQTTFYAHSQVSTSEQVDLNVVPLIPTWFAYDNTQKYPTNACDYKNMKLLEVYEIFLINLGLLTFRYHPPESYNVSLWVIVQKRNTLYTHTVSNNQMIAL